MWGDGKKQGAYGRGKEFKFKDGSGGMIFYDTHLGPNGGDNKGTSCALLLLVLLGAPTIIAVSSMKLLVMALS